MIFLRIRQARFIPGMNAGAFVSKLGKNKFISYHGLLMTVKEIDEDWSIFVPTISRDSSLPPYAVLSVVSKRKTKDTHLLGSSRKSSY